jgi:hypothetical protein
MRQSLFCSSDLEYRDLLPVFRCVDLDFELTILVEESSVVY